MWWNYIAQRLAAHLAGNQVADPVCAQSIVSVVCRTKDGREFSPSSIEWRGARMVLCESEGAE